MSPLDMMGVCEKCKLPIWENTNYKYNEYIDKYWHTKCLPNTDIDCK